MNAAHLLDTLGRLPDAARSLLISARLRRLLVLVVSVSSAIVGFGAALARAACRLVAHQHLITLDASSMRVLP